MRKSPHTAESPDMLPGLNGLAADNFDFAAPDDGEVEYERNESENVQARLEREHAARTHTIERHLAFHGL